MVKLGKYEVELKRPSSFMVAREVTIAIGQNALRGLGAALGVCWGGKSLKATYAGSKYDMLAYGGAVVDELVALGVPEAHIYEAGRQAIDIIVAALPREEEVATVAGFTEVQKEPSTP